MASAPNTTAASTSPPKSPSIHVREPSTTKASIPPQSMHTLSPLNYTPAGARSPSASGSIPSSPTSIHSSSSAIFERDIEQPLSATTSSLHVLHKDPHYTARAVAHEPLENSVPSVLSAAVTALGEVDSASLTAPHTGGGPIGGKEIRKGMSMDDISVIAPAPLSPQNWTASTAGSIRLSASRSPSPHLLPLPGLPYAAGQQQQQQWTSAANRTTRPGVPQRLNTGGSVDGDNGLATATAVPPTSATSSVIGVVPPTPNANSSNFASPPGTKPSNSGSTSPQSAAASPLIVTPPLPVGAATGIPIARSGGASRSTSRPTSIAMSLEELSLAPLIATTTDSPVPVPPDVEPIAFSGSAHPRPPSPNASTSNNASKRLSFISYNDLLNSTPMSSFPLSSVTSGSAEPPHQVDVTLRSPRRTRTNSRQSTLNRSPVSDVFGTRTSVFEDENLGGVLLSTAAAAGATGAVANSQGSLQQTHDVGPKAGGEWEREGLGSGMEERLEASLKEKQARERDVAPSNSSAVGA